MTTTTDTWILVSVPSRTERRDHLPLLDRAAVRGGLGLLAWAGRTRRTADPRSVDLARVDRALPAPRPFC